MAAFNSPARLPVMAINEILMQMLMAKNPDASFAIEHPFVQIHLCRRHSARAHHGTWREDQNNTSRRSRPQSVGILARGRHRSIGPIPKPTPRRSQHYAKMAAEQAAFCWTATTRQGRTELSIRDCTSLRIPRRFTVTLPLLTARNVRRGNPGAGECSQANPNNSNSATCWTG